MASNREMIDKLLASVNTERGKAVTAAFQSALSQDVDPTIQARVPAFTPQTVHWTKAFDPADWAMPVEHSAVYDAAQQQPLQGAGYYCPVTDPRDARIAELKTELRRHREAADDMLQVAANRVADLEAANAKLQEIFDIVAGAAERVISQRDALKAQLTELEFLAALTTQENELLRGVFAAFKSPSANERNGVMGFAHVIAWRSLAGVIGFVLGYVGARS